MTEDDADEPDVAPAVPERERTTAPQSPYTTRHVAVGVGVLAVGVGLTFGLALALV